MNLKFLFPLLGVACGILLSADFLSSLWFPLFSIGSALIIWLFINRLSKNPLTGRTLSSWHSLWIFLLFEGVGALDYDTFSSSHSPDTHPGRLYDITGRVLDVQTLASGDRFNLSVETLQDSLGNRLEARNLNLQLRTDGYTASVGDILSFQTKLKNFTNEKFASRMKHEGIDYYANVKSEEIQKIGSSSSLVKVFNSWREDLIILIEKCKLGRETSGFLISVLLGDTLYMKDDVHDSLSSAGLAHILALSGMHVAIVLAIVMALLFPLSLFGLGRTRKVMAMIVIWGYVLLTGASPSTVRAAIMATLVLGAFVLQRKNSPLNALLAAVMLILLVQPLALWDIGLQMSFLCVASIIIFVERLNPVDHHIHPRMFKTINLILVTLVTTFATWVLISYYFGAVPLLFLPANILLLPFLPLFLGLAILYVVALLFGYDFHFLAICIDFFYENFINLASRLSMDGAAVVKTETPGTIVVVWLIGVMVLGLGLYSKIRRKKQILISGAFSLLAVCIVLVFLNSGPSARESSLKFHHSFTSMEATLAMDDRLYRLSFPRGSLSEAEYEGVKITSIDRVILPDSLLALVNHTGNKRHFLFLGSRADNAQIAGLIGSGIFEGIVLHPGIGKKKKADLLRLLEKSLWDKVYSLRESGSVEFPL